MTIPEISRIGVVALLLVGAAIDLRTHRIPNVLTFGGALAGFIVNFVQNREAGLLNSGAGWLVGVALLVIPFLMRGIGGGDVKLLAAVGAWGGPLFAINAAFFGALAGSLVAVGLLIGRGEVGLAIRPLVRLIRWRIAVTFAGVMSDSQTELVKPKGNPDVGSPMKSKFPWGPALAIGGLTAIILG